MSSLKSFLLFGAVSALLATVDAVAIETRTIDQIYKAALKEGGVLTVMHGGDEKVQGDGLKAAFEARFPGIKLNSTINLSKYIDGQIDQQLAGKNVYVDQIMLQTLQDFPRWKAEGALMYYKPLGFDKIFPEFKDAEGAWNGASLFGWSNIWNKNYVTNPPKEYTDYLKPEFKNKLVITYPNDDDAVLRQFDLIIQKYGWKWFDALVAQNPRWVRGTATAVNLIISSNGTYVATFGSGIGLQEFGPLGVSFPAKSDFVTWSQGSAILKNAPHPESAKLLQSWLLSLERQNMGGWSPRMDANKPANYSLIKDIPNTHPETFLPWMQDRARVERLRFLFEDKIGTPQGLSPLEDNL